MNCRNYCIGLGLNYVIHLFIPVNQWLETEQEGKLAIDNKEFVFSPCIWTCSMSEFSDHSTGLESTVQASLFFSVSLKVIRFWYLVVFNIACIIHLVFSRSVTDKGGLPKDGVFACFVSWSQYTKRKVSIKQSKLHSMTIEFRCGDMAYKAASPLAKGERAKIQYFFNECFFNDIKSERRNIHVFSKNGQWTPWNQSSPFLFVLLRLLVFAMAIVNSHRTDGSVI